MALRITTRKPYDFILSGNERTYTDLVTASGLEEIVKYAQAVGIHKNLLVPRDNSGNTVQLSLKLNST
ncbi:hypothetical protein LC586_26865 [Nostoc sp. CHAB 5714]|uniref:Uncharacterized protein n=1 Tax=Nostoc favosum CHAB5714 TaxID=2780399 RepID=A0ABS8IER6_9NOSO|nr:hypothetical protein [Nostoc favosum]MCC5602717.1 hypothetical protein [Nostoc favosum CHAB5714]